MLDWNDFKFAQAVASAGSVRGAGELLGVHGSTVARHLDNLEQRLGIRLFSRTPRGMELTPAGADIVEVLDRVAAEFDDVEQRLQARTPALSGAVGLALPMGVAAELIIPELAGFQQNNPEVDLALLVGPPQAHLAAGSVDMALWLTDEPPEDLIGRPLGGVAACVYATPEVLAALSGGADPPPVRWIGPDDPASLSARIRARHFPRLGRGLRVTDAALAARALAGGLGVGLLPCLIGDATPGLARAPAMGPVDQGQVWLFTRPDARGAAPVQALSAFLQNVFANHKARLAGTAGDR